MRPEASWVPFLGPGSPNSRMEAGIPALGSEALCSGKAGGSGASPTSQREKELWRAGSRLRGQPRLCPAIKVVSALSPWVSKPRLDRCLCWGSGHLTQEPAEGLWSPHKAAHSAPCLGGKGRQSPVTPS